MASSKKENDQERRGPQIQQDSTDLLEISQVPLSEETTSTKKPVDHKRGTWTVRFDFLHSLLGYSVGLGNVWRFPYLCYKRGSDAFLIPYTTMLIINGLPPMFMELSIGQFTALGPIVFNRFCPLLRGLGYSIIIVSAMVMLYNNIIIAWIIIYMVVSFRFTDLPWKDCDPEWSTNNCYSYEKAELCESRNGTYYLRTCYNASLAEMFNITLSMTQSVPKRTPAQEYFTGHVLGLSSGIEETGHIKLSLAMCLLVAWIIVFLCKYKGVRSSGKIAYFTVWFPYVAFVILFIRGVTLPGAGTGIINFLTPDWTQLLDAQVWGDAVVQSFFALSPIWGGLITLSSYNKFNNNCYRDFLIVVAANILTSFFAGLVMFCIVGFLAHEQDVDMDKVMDHGVGLAFIVYPEVVTRLPISQLWSLLFFSMLLTFGLHFQFALMETVTTAILDKFSKLRQYRIWVVLSVAIFGYIGGLGFTTNSGMYWVQLLEKYAVKWSVLTISITECIVIAWLYGSETFLNDIQKKIGRRSRVWVLFWSCMWRYVTPGALLLILCFNWVKHKPASYGQYEYPPFYNAIGWFLGLFPIAIIIITAIGEIMVEP